MSDIKRAIWGAFGYMYEYRASLVKALLVPFVILLAVENFMDPEMGWVFVLLIFIYLFICTVIAIITHRIVLLGPESVPEWGVYIPQIRELYFILYSIGVGVCMIPFSLFAAMIPVIGIFIAIAGACYVMARLSLVFPAIATDREWSFSRSWKATENHQLLMIVVVAIIPFVIGVPGQLLSFVPYMGFLVALLSVFTMVYVVAALSVAFQIIVENKGALSDERA